MKANDLQELIDQFRNIIGEKFSNKLDSYNEIGIKIHIKDKMRASAHPLFLLWPNFMKEAKKSIEINKIQLSEKSISIILFIQELIFIKEIPRFDDLLKRILIPTKFFSAKFETKIASSYYSLGYKIEVVEESKHKTPDFKIELNTKENIYIECKSIENKKEIESNLWFVLEKKIYKLCRKYRKSWYIEVYPKNNITGKDISLIAKEFEEYFKNNVIGSFIINGFLFKIAIIAEYGKEYNISNFSFPKLDLGTMRGNIRTVSGKSYISNGIIFQVKQFSNLFRENSLLNIIKSAYKQLSRNYSNIVHIEIPYIKGSDVFEIVDNSYNTISSKLIKDYKKLSAVVLSSEVLPNYDKNGYYSPINHYIIIPNFKENIKLPSIFKILGTEDNKSLKNKIFNQEGSFFFEFELKNEFILNQGLNLFNYVSNDGKFQIKLWRTYKDKLRVEIINPSIIRLVADFNLQMFMDNTNGKVLISWLINKITLATGGKVIELSKINT